VLLSFVFVFSLTNNTSTASTSNQLESLQLVARRRHRRLSR
jgi:hypothetical protein